MNNTFRKAALLFASLGGVTSLAQEKPKTPEMVEVGTKPEPPHSRWGLNAKEIGQGALVVAGADAIDWIVKRIRRSRGGPSP
jgi:hypothetical protein